MADAGLSTYARLIRKGMFEKFQQGESGPRTNARSTALPGFTRGSLGSMGATGYRNRNPNAAVDKDRDFLRQTIMDAFKG